MKIIVRLVVVFFLSAAVMYARPVTVTVAQCRSALSQLSAVHTDDELQHLFAAMTSGDEMQLSTRFALCVNQHSDALSAAEITRLNLIIYRLDVDVMAKMWAFIEKHHLGDEFNDEQEAKRAK